MFCISSKTIKRTLDGPCEAGICGRANTPENSLARILSPNIRNKTSNSFSGLKTILSKRKTLRV